jgi:hypothetical protein
MCEELAVIDFGNGDLVSRIWSNSATTGDDSPCLPRPNLPAFYAVSATPSEYASASAGQKVGFVLRGWSTQAIGAWHLEPYATEGFDARPVVSTASLNNGQSAVLTLTVPATAQSGDYAIVTVYSYEDNPLDDTLGWRVGVYVP